MSEEAVKTEEAKEELKVVVNIKGTSAMLGVQKPGCDPVFETIADTTFEQALAAVPALVELARLRWSTNPRNPKYDRPMPTPPAATQPAPRPATPERTTSGKKKGQEQVEEYKLL